MGAAIPEPDVTGDRATSDKDKGADALLSLFNAQLQADAKVGK